MNITSSGIGSGIDVKELVDKLIESESKEKIKKFDADEASTLAKITAYGTLKSAMSEFADKLTQLESINQFEMRQATAPNLNNVEIISATATADATPGNYSIEVIQLALAQKSGSANFAQTYSTVGTGTLTFTIGLAQYSFDITTANQTLQGISNTINAASGSTGISASLITSDAGTSIVFSSLTGTNNAFTVSVTNDGDANNTDASGLSRLASNNLTTLQSARDALVKIEGVSVTSDYNVIKNAINGVEIELVATNENSPITLSINVDVDRAKLAIKEFVDSYNSVFESVKKLTQYEQHPNAKSTTGILIGDSTLRGIEFQMRRIITEIVTSQPAGFTTLSQIGITSDQYTGNLIIDDQQLTEALNTNFDAVGQLFMDPTTGVVNNMESFLENYVEINGILQTRTDGLNKSIEVITEQRINLERHLKSLEKRLITQFIAMDTIVARLRSLSEYLETQLENLPQPMMFRK